MLRQKVLAAIAVACMVAPVAGAATEELTIIAWNVESGGADPQVLAQRIADFDGCDIWGLSEVNDESWVAQFEIAAEFEEEADFDAMTGTTGRSDRLVIIYDTTELDLLHWEELQNINIRGRVRAPLVAHFRYKPSGDEFLFVVNHLYRSNNEGRHEQARLLNEWAAEQTLPIICAGDMNFDWSVRDRGKTHDRGFDLLTANDTFKWLRPARIVSAQDSRYNSILDFIFIAGEAPWQRAKCQIIVERGDFPDDETTSDHRPVLGRFYFRDRAVAESESEAATLRQQILERIEKIEAELRELRELVEQLEDGA